MRVRKQKTPTVFGPPERISIDPSARIQPDNILNTISGRIEIGKYAFTGHRVMILTGAHDHKRFGPARKDFAFEGGHDVIIEEGVWIASGAVVIGPCRIGKHSVVAACSVVTSDVPPYVVVGGNPARILERIPPGESEELKKNRT